MAALALLVALVARRDRSPRGSDPPIPRRRRCGPRAAALERRLQDHRRLRARAAGAARDQRSVRRRHGLAALRLNRDARRRRARPLALDGRARLLRATSPTTARRSGGGSSRRTGRELGRLLGRRREHGLGLARPQRRSTAVEMWLKSPPHRKNLLTPAWREIGIGGVHALAAPGVYRGPRRHDRHRRLRRQIARRVLRLRGSRPACSISATADWYGLARRALPLSRAPVAQGTERRPSKPRVGGSNPPRRIRMQDGRG